MIVDKAETGVETPMASTLKNVGLSNGQLEPIEYRKDFDA
jgi:hypothetical protein